MKIAQVLSIAVVAAIISWSSAEAADTVRAGIRGGGSVGDSSYYTEAFGDFYLNRLFSLGGAVGFTSVDRGDSHGDKKDKSVPVAALFKVHAPIPFFKPYAGLGAALVFHDDRGVKGSPVALAGINFDPFLLPVFINLEYRRQFDDKLDFLGAGAGVRF